MIAIQQPDSRAVIILGMHRSGTSMLTRCVHLLGAEIAQRVIPTDVAINKDGFFEDAQMVALNDELLCLLDRTWYDFRPLPLNMEPSLQIQKWQGRALEHVQEEYAPKKYSVVKDPRMSRLWPYWAKLFEQASLDVDLIHIVRRPQEVALSLQRRDAMPLAYGLLLWCEHVVSILNCMHAHGSRKTVFYDALVSEPGKSVNLIAALLEAEALASSDKTAIAEEIDRRGPLLAEPGAGFEQQLSMIQPVYDFSLRTYDSLNEHSGNGMLELTEQALERINVGYQELLSHSAVALQTLRELTAQMIATNSELVKIGSLHTNAQAVVAERDDQLADIQSDLKRVGSELEHAQSVVVERDDQLVCLEEALRRTSAELEQARSQVVDLDGQLKQVRKSLQRNSAELRHEQSLVSERSTDSVELTDRLEKSQSELRNLQLAIVEKDKQIAALRKKLKAVEVRYKTIKRAFVKRGTRVADLNARVAQYNNVWFRRALRYLRRIVP